MTLVFCTTDKPLSKLIRWITGEPASHFAMVFDDRLVISASILGVDLRWWSNFRWENRIVSCLVPKDLSLDSEEEHYQNMIADVEDEGYDYRGLLYMLLVGVSHKILGTRVPKNNPWRTPGRVWCTGIAARFGLKENESEIISAWGLKKLLLETGKYSEVT